ncbi:ATP-binding protein [Methylobacillus methanolivorans]|uniref:ATP-binding protein n=1 Tax=Methylobacillus methanolivorans TaxID=1848927 RepID=A0ABW8GJK1_9PROT
MITIREWSPGINPSELPKILTRFWRGAHRRDHGAGLGLTICQKIALAHHWTLLAQNAEPGLCFHLSNTSAALEDGPNTHNQCGSILSACIITPIYCHLDNV